MRADKGTLARLSFWLRERGRLLAGWQWIAAFIVAALLGGAIVFWATTDFTLTKWGDVAKLAGGLLSVIAAVWLFAGWVGRFATLNSHRAAKPSLRTEPTRWKSWRSTSGGY